MRGFATARDIRDLGEEGEKEWQEFRATFASAGLFAWLLSELAKVARVCGGSSAANQ